MRQSFRSIVAEIIVLAIAAVAVAGEPVEIRLKDGSRWTGQTTDKVDLTYRQRGVEINATGTLVTAAEYYITIETDVAGELRNKTIFKNDILKISTVGGESAPRAGASGRSGADVANVANPSTDLTKTPDRKTPGVFVLPLSGRVGVEFRHEEMEKIAEEADKYGSGQIIVLLIDSGGGLVTEIEQIHETLSEIKKRHRLVAWVKQAISAACATAVHCHEIYFMKTGTAGAMTAFNGSTMEAWSGPELDRWMQRAGDWMESGGRSRYIAEAMIHAPNMLSYDKDPATGEVTFYNDLSGKTILSRPGENLVFTASTALDCGFSDGTANNEQELAKFLHLPEWYETSQYGRDIAQEWQDTVKRGTEEIRLLKRRLEYAGSGSGDATKVLAKRIQIYEQFLRWHDRCPNCAMMEGLPPKDQLQREIVEMRRRLAEMKRR